MKHRIFIDMDGTIARFHDEVQYLERMFEKNFFSSLKPFENAVTAVNAMAAMYNMEVYVLSATVDGEPPYCSNEKHHWLDVHCPNIDHEHRIFTQMGQPKSDYIPNGIRPTDILWDDYNKNLEEWRNAGGLAVKCHNNINHKGLVGSLWEGEIIRNDAAPAELCDYFRTLAYYAAANMQEDNTAEDDNEWDL